MTRKTKKNRINLALQNTEFQADVFPFRDLDSSTVTMFPSHDNCTPGIVNNANLCTYIYSKETTDHLQPPFFMLNYS